MNKKNAHLAGIHRCMSTHEPILQQRESQLNESLHVFDGIDEKYHDKISDAANKLISKLYNGNTIPYIKGMRREYTKYTITDILPKIKECNVYVGINSNMEPDSSDAILISYNDMNDAEVFIDIEQPVVIFEDGIYERIALRIEIDRYTAANKIKLENSIESSITHELMHMYHQCKKESLTNNSGNAYYHANMIFELLNMDFPQKQDIINDNMLPIVYYPLLMYFCADSELSAWMLSYYKEAVYAVQKLHTSPYNKTPEEIKQIFNHPTYRLYERLLNALSNNMNFYCNILDNVPDYIADQIQEYCRDLNIKNIKHLPKVWKSKIEKFLRDACAVHYRICDETFIY